MEFADVVRKRGMVRTYDPDRPVPPQVIDQILEHAIRAPSAGFSQGWGFLVLETADERARFWATATPDDSDVWSSWLVGMRSAPLIIVPCSNKSVYLDRYAEPDKGWTDRDEARWPVPFWHIDTGMATLLMLLTAVDNGLGACYFGIPPECVQRFKAEFGVPADFSPIGAVSVGYRAADRKSPSLKRGRRSVDEVAHRGRWAA
jgi:nitroreductase